MNFGWLPNEWLTESNSLIKLFKDNLMVTKAKPLKSENKHLHIVTHPCIPSKEGNSGIYFLIYSVMYLLL